MKIMMLQQLCRDDVLAVMPSAGNRVDRYLPFFNKYAEKYEVNTTLRMAHLLAQVAHESGELRYKRELASGVKYEGRKDLGNTQKGDGVRFKGRGFIQVTGRYNYGLVSQEFGVDFVSHPELLEQDEWAVASIFWYWKRARLNEFADKDDIETITLRINGGNNGMKYRKEYLRKAKEVFRL